MSFFNRSGYYSKSDELLLLRPTRLSNNCADILTIANFFVKIRSCRPRKPFRATEIACSFTSDSEHSENLQIKASVVRDLLRGLLENCYGVRTGLLAPPGQPPIYFVRGDRFPSPQSTYQNSVSASSDSTNFFASRLNRSRRTHCSRRLLENTKHPVPPQEVCHISGMISPLPSECLHSVLTFAANLLCLH